MKYKEEEGGKVRRRRGRSVGRRKGGREEEGKKGNWINMGEARVTLASRGTWCPGTWSHGENLKAKDRSPGRRV